VAHCPLALWESFYCWLLHLKLLSRDLGTGNPAHNVIWMTAGVPFTIHKGNRLGTLDLHHGPGPKLRVWMGCLVGPVDTTCRLVLMKIDRDIPAHHHRTGQFHILVRQRTCFQFFKLFHCFHCYWYFSYFQYTHSWNYKYLRVLIINDELVVSTHL